MSYVTHVFPWSAHTPEFTLPVTRIQGHGEGDEYYYSLLDGSLLRVVHVRASPYDTLYPMIGS